MLFVISLRWALLIVLLTYGIKNLLNNLLTSQHWSSGFRAPWTVSYPTGTFPSSPLLAWWPIRHCRRTHLQHALLQFLRAGKCFYLAIFIQINQYIHFYLKWLKRRPHCSYNSMVRPRNIVSYIKFYISLFKLITLLSTKKDNFIIWKCV